MKKVFSLIVSFVLCVLCYPANILPVVADEEEYVIAQYNGTRSVRDVDRPDILYSNCIDFQIIIMSNGFVGCNFKTNEFIDRYLADDCFTVALTWSLPTTYGSKSNYSSNVSDSSELGDMLCKKSCIPNGTLYSLDYYAYYQRSIKAVPVIRTGTGGNANLRQICFDKWTREYQINIDLNLDSMANFNPDTVFNLFGYTFTTQLFDTSGNITNKPESNTGAELDETSVLVGDTDGNGKISIVDSVILNRYLAGTVDSLPCSDPPPVDESEDDE